MTNKKYLIAELLCVAALITFIVLICVSRSGGTDKKISDVAAPVVKTMEKNQMTKKTNADAVKAFKLDLSLTDGVVYYANNNVMDVSELLIVKLKDKSDAPDLKEKVDLRVSEQKKLYKSYAPKQYSLLENSITETSGNVLFYCTAENAVSLFEKFKEAL